MTTFTLSTVVNEAQLLAEAAKTSEDARQTVRQFGDYLGLYRTVTWMLMECATRSEERDHEKRKACQKLIDISYEEFSSEFWRAWARIQLGMLEWGGEERQKLFDWARRGMSSLIADEHSVDHDYINRQVRWRELHRTGMTAEEWVELLKVTIEAMDCGDFEAPYLALQMVMERPKVELSQDGLLDVKKLYQRFAARRLEPGCFFSKYNWGLFENYCQLRIEEKQT